MSDLVLVAIVAGFFGLPTGVAAIIGAVRSTQAARETKPNGGGSMRDEITRIGVEVSHAKGHAAAATTAATAASVAAEEASIAAKRADTRANIAADGVARADAFHIYMHDRVHDLANGLLSNRGQIAALRRELGLDALAPERKPDARDMLPDRLYPPSGQAIPDDFDPNQQEKP